MIRGLVALLIIFSLNACLAIQPDDSSSECISNNSVWLDNWGLIPSFTLNSLLSRATPICLNPEDSSCPIIGFESIGLADINGDGFTDIAAGDGNNYVYRFLNNKAGGFSYADTSSTYSSYYVKYTSCNPATSTRCNFYATTYTYYNEFARASSGTFYTGAFGADVIDFQNASGNNIMAVLNRAYGYPELSGWNLNNVNFSSLELYATNCTGCGGYINTPICICCVSGSCHPACSNWINACPFGTSTYPLSEISLGSIPTNTVDMDVIDMNNDLNEEIITTTYQKEMININGDSYPDAFTNENGASYRLNNAGTLGSAVRISVNTSTSQVITSGDYDNDGDTDFFTAVQGASYTDLYAYVNNAGTSFTERYLGRVPLVITVLASNNLNRNGPDEVIYGASNGEIGFYTEMNYYTPDYTPGNYSFTQTYFTNIADSDDGNPKGPVTDIKLSDLDNDGDTDMVISRGKAYHTIYTPNVYYNHQGEMNVYVYLNTGNYGAYGPCCGDDGLLDDFYNGTVICDNGNAYTEPDDLKQLCTLKSHEWLEDGTGVNASCCGDDGLDDNFYNGTIGTTTNFCVNGSLINQEIDSNETICNNYAYPWITNPSGSNYSCCGDDGIYDVFNNSIDYCINGEPLNLSSMDFNAGLCTYAGHSWINQTNPITFRTKSLGSFASNGPSKAIDFDKDGYNDVIATNGPEVYLIDNNNGVFTKQSLYTFSYSYNVRKIEVLDFDNDGDYDVLAGYTYDGPNSLILLIRNDGSGTFTPVTLYTLNSVSPNDIYYALTWDVGDLDGDTDNDFVIWLNEVYDQPIVNRIYWLRNDGGYGFTGLLIKDNSIGGSFAMIELSDLDNNGYKDIVAFDGSSYTRIYQNNGDGSFTELNPIGSINYPQFLLLADYNKDGLSDIFTGLNNGVSIYYYRNTGSFTFSRQTIMIPYSSTGLRIYEVTDLNNDGTNDLLSGTYWIDGSSVKRDYGADLRSDYFSPSTIDFDNDTDLDIIIGGTKLENTYITGSNASCCGNDGIYDNFYNTTTYCYQGLIVTDGDGSENVCAWQNNAWLNGEVTGDNSRCCGDDGLLDTFYNGSISNTTNFCQNGTYLNQEIDQNNTLCNNYYNNKWVDGVILGNSTIQGCCGDDGTSDVFYNDTIACYQGALTTDMDAWINFCKADPAREWLTGDIINVGGNDYRPCCGDDGLGESFYNATGGFGGYCLNGSYFYGDSDTSSGICEFVRGTWFSGANGDYSKCCGDDNGLDDFGNGTNACCCNGDVVASGTYCDLDGDGDTDSQCINGNLPSVYVTQSTFTNAYVTEDYNPMFMLRNTGNDTICVISATLTNTTLNYNPSPSNPSCITPGNSGLFAFNFEAFTCDDLDTEFYPVLNITYNSTSGKTESMLRYLNVMVKSPLDITSITPSINEVLTVPLNEFETILVTLKNEGETGIDYNITTQIDPGMILLFTALGKTYASEQISTETFNMQPKSTRIYNIKAVPSSSGLKTARVTFNNMNGCSNVTDFISFQVNGLVKTTHGAYVANAWDDIMIFSLLIIAGFVIYKKF